MQILKPQFCVQIPRRNVLEVEFWICVLNFLSLLSLNQIDKNTVNKIIKLSVFVNSSSTFIDIPKVADGASNLIVDFFGKTVGQHSRTAVGVNSLPRNATCEIDFIFSKPQLKALFA